MLRKVLPAGLNSSIKFGSFLCFKNTEIIVYHINKSQKWIIKSFSFININEKFFQTFSTKVISGSSSVSYFLGYSLLYPFLYFVLLFQLIFHKYFLWHLMAKSIGIGWNKNESVFQISVAITFPKSSRWMWLSFKNISSKRRPSSKVPGGYSAHAVELPVEFQPPRVPSNLSVLLLFVVGYPDTIHSSGKPTRKVARCLVRLTCRPWDIE